MASVEYEIDNRERVKIPDKDGNMVNSGLLKPAMATKKPEKKSLKSANKEMAIEKKHLDRTAQLNLIALIVKQIGDKVGLDTPEFTYAKEKFAAIEAELAK